MEFKRDVVSLDTPPYARSSKKADETTCARSKAQCRNLRVVSLGSTEAGVDGAYEMAYELQPDETRSTVESPWLYIETFLRLEGDGGFTIFST